jgi:hypothetical protein
MNRAEKACSKPLMSSGTKAREYKEVKKNTFTFNVSSTLTKEWTRGLFENNLWHSRRVQALDEHVSSPVTLYILVVSLFHCTESDPHQTLH